MTPSRSHDDPTGWTSARKLEVLMESLAHPRQTAALCRREGVTTEQLAAWRRRLEQAADRVFAPPPPADAHAPAWPTLDDRPAPAEGRKRRVRSSLRDYPGDVVFGVCEAFMKGTPVRQIVAWLRARGYPHATREQVYPILSEGLKRHYLELRPPADQVLRERLDARYGHARINYKVVNVSGLTLSAITNHVAMEAARLTLNLVKEYQRQPVHIGFGAGRTVKQVARHLADLLHFEAPLPHLVLHALGSGFSAQDPATSANTFFGFFHDAAERGTIEYEGLLGDVFVRWDEYEQVKQQPGVREAFNAKDHIDIVITTITSAEDKHGLMHRFMTLAPDEGRRILQRAGWVGDVLWRPFSPDGPIHENTIIRAISVFEIEDLVRLAHRPGKHVIAVAAPCVDCGRTRGDALRPLLTVPSLNVCSHLVLDATTAREMLEPAKAG